MIREIIEDFGKGLNTMVHPTKIGKDEFAVFENYIIRSPGNLPGATKRNGFQRANSNQFDVPSSILSAYEFTQNGATDKVIVNNNAASPEIGYCVSPYTGAFTTLGNGARYGFKLRHVSFDNKDYIHNINNGAGAGEVYYYDTVKSADRFLEMGLPPCPQTFTLANGKSGGGTMANARGYIITFIYNDKYESGIVPISENSPSYLVLTPANQSGTGSMLLQNIPVGNSRVTGRRIYATKEWSADGVTTFYYLDTIYDNSTTEYEDVTPDAQLIEEIDTSILYKPRAFGAKYAGTMQNRLFLGNVSEVQYTAPDDTPVNLANSGDTGVQALNKLAKYTYKFAYLFYNLNGSTPSWITVTTTERIRWSNYSGIYSALSAGRSHQLTTVNNSIDITDIDDITSDTYAAKRIVTFRNIAFSVNAFTAGATTRLTKDSTASHTCDCLGYKVGEKVTIEGGTGAYAAINGTHTITAVSNNYIDIAFDSSAILAVYTAHMLKVQGQTWYARQISYYGDTTPNVFDFTDETPDYSGSASDLISGATAILNEAGLGIVVPSEGNKSYPSRIYYSEAGEPDHIKSTSYFDMFSEDGDSIIGVRCSDDGVLAIKDTNYAYLYCNSDDPRLWQRRKIVSGWGGSDGLLAETPEGVIVIKSSNIAAQPLSIYLWSGGGIPNEIDLKLRRYVKELTSTGSVICNDVCYDKYNNWVWVLVTYTDDAAQTYDIAFVYDMIIKQWYIMVNRNTRLGLVCAADTRNYGMLFGSTISYLIKYDTSLYKDKLGTGHSDTAILSRIRTKTFTAEGELVLKMVRADIETIGGTPSTKTAALKYKTDTISEQSINLNYTDSVNVQRLKNRTFTNAHSGSYRECYIGIEDSNTTFGHVLKALYIDMDERHRKAIGK